jgi:large conductance mechanosensitive channel
VIIGAAFGAIITSLVNDIIMPLVGVILGGLDFTSLSVQVEDAVIAYGKFIQAIVNFVIVGFVLYLLVKGINKVYKKKEAAAAPPPGPSEEVVLLGEIRDLLKKN